MSKPTIAIRIKELRESRSLTVRDLSLELGISKSTISGWENDSRKPDYNAITKLSNYFNVSSDYLLGLTDDKYNFDYKYNVNEIVYKQLLFLASKKNLDERKNFSLYIEAIKDGTYSITPITLQALADVFDTNTLFLLGNTDIYYSEDPMDDNFTSKVKAQTEDIFHDINNYLIEYSKNRNEEYLKETTNKAYNTLNDLGIYKIKNKSLVSIEPKMLIAYYNTIINYIKSTIKLVDFNKLIDEENYNCNNDEKYYYDYYSKTSIHTIDDIKNGREFVSYLSFLLKSNNYLLYPVQKISENHQSFYYDLIATKNGIDYYFELKVYSNFATLKKAAYQIYRIFNSVNDKTAKKILVVNFAINENQRNELIDIINNVSEIWDYTYLKKLEI